MSATAERFDRYMDRCLYDPNQGFYASEVGSAGRRAGDFITSPEVGPLFAEVLARALDEWWEALGKPDPYRIYDAGTGPGTLAQMLERAPGASRAARQLEGFDRSAGTADPPAIEAGSVVIANELLDNLSFRILARSSDGWREAWVHSEGQGPPVERFGPLDPIPNADRAALLDRLPVGARVPLLDGANSWVRRVLDQEPAVLVAFDYGTKTTAELADRGGWLRTYRGHTRGDDPYHQPGQWDITTDIALDQLPTPDDVVTQAEFLRRWGIDEMVEEGRRYWSANAAAPDMAAFKMRSRIAESEALLDPGGLGGWLVCCWSAHNTVRDPVRNTVRDPVRNSIELGGLHRN